MQIISEALSSGIVDSLIDDVKRKEEKEVPYKSKKQAKLMRAVAHSKKFAKKVGIPQSVGKKYEAHKAGRKRAKRRSRSH